MDKDGISEKLMDLYRRCGYTRYRMSKFEEYDLYSRNREFLPSDQIITFTDTDGRLMALKPDVLQRERVPVRPRQRPVRRDTADGT